MSVLVARYNEWGYTVYGINELFSYSAGNSPWDSDQYLDPDDPYALPLEEIKTMAQTTLEEMVQYHPEVRVNGGLDYDDSGDIP